MTLLILALAALLAATFLAAGVAQAHFDGVHDAVRETLDRTRR